MHISPLSISPTFHQEIFISKGFHIFILTIMNITTLFASSKREYISPLSSSPTFSQEIVVSVMDYIISFQTTTMSITILLAPSMPVHCPIARYLVKK
ncbi:hypothetical protein CDAR_26071 [Caerostris darwini]|uniref:Uncharacterized protein n=1 Tax=Caerostris darwini TaxID=1538125 RepID=A0AAV4MUK7_9ARAC|nr:hypothetical protein CDAR_26071 [Caerostris darwini]